MKEVVLEEPTFEEIIMIYRKKSNTVSSTKCTPDKSRNTIKPISQTHQTLMPSTSNATIIYQWRSCGWYFPPKKSDAMQQTIFIICSCWGRCLRVEYWLYSWVLTSFVKLQTAWAQSTYLDELVIAILFVLSPLLLKYVTGIILNFRASRYAREKLQMTLSSNSLNCNRSVVAYLNEISHIQSFKVLILAYFVVHEWRVGIRVVELDTAVELLVKEVLGEIVDFPVSFMSKGCLFLRSS